MPGFGAVLQLEGVAQHIICNVALDGGLGGPLCHERAVVCLVDGAALDVLAVGQATLQLQAREQAE